MDELEQTLVNLGEQRTALEARVQERERTLREPQRKVEQAHAALTNRVRTLDAEYARLSADGRDAPPGHSLLTPLHAASLAVCVATLFAASPAVSHEGPRVLIIALILAGGSALGGFLRGR